MLTLLLKLFSWVPDVLPQALSILNKFSDNSAAQLAARTAASTSIVAAAASADVAVNTLKAQEQDKDRAWWATAWEKPLLFYLCLMHFAAVIIDSTFRLHWGIPKLPSPYDTYEGAVILSDVIVLSTAGLTQKVAASIWK